MAPAPKSPAARPVDWPIGPPVDFELVDQIRQAVSTDLRQEANERSDDREEHARALIAAAVADLAHADQPRLARTVFDRMFRLGGLQPLIDNRDVTDILVNGFDDVWVIRSTGMRERCPSVARSDQDLIEILQGAARQNPLGEREFNPTHPSLNLHLADGSRLFAAAWVCKRVSVSVRRHRWFECRLDDLVRLGTLDDAMAGFLAAAVRARMQILVSGGMGAGKTTLLRALAAEIAPVERLVTVESELELGLDEFREAHPDCVALEAREANLEGLGAVTQATLIRWTQRMRPDRVIVGEIRGDEVLGLLNAMSNGLDGSMGTIHASSSAGAFHKLAQYAIQTPERIPFDVTAALAAAAINLSVHLAHSYNGRVVSSIRFVTGHDGPRVISEEIYGPARDGHATPTGVFPAELAERLTRVGYQRPEPAAR